MRNFVKYFFIALLSQVLLTGLMWIKVPVLSTIYEITVLIFYIEPRVILFPYKAPGKKIISDFELFGVPMILWSIAIGSGICFVTWLVRRDGEQFK